jgi:sulfite exporter TauE/SafE
LVTLRAKPTEAGESKTSRVLRALGRHPFLVGLGTALLPCGALAAAVLIAASTGQASLGASSMLAFAVVSGAGLVGAAWLFERISRQPHPVTSRVLAVVLALGSILFVIRPVHALRHGEHAGCHAPASSESADPSSLEHDHSHAP